MLRLRKQGELNNEVLVTIALNESIPVEDIKLELPNLMQKVKDGFDQMLPNLEHWSEVTINNDWKLGAKH